jgi:hypothetical protein
MLVQTTHATGQGVYSKASPYNCHPRFTPPASPHAPAQEVAHRILASTWWAVRKAAAELVLPWITMRVMTLAGVMLIRTDRAATGSP